MDHGGQVPMPTTVESTDFSMPGAVQGGEAHMSASTFHGVLGAAATRRASFEASAEAYHNSTEYALHVRVATGRGEVPEPAALHRERACGAVLLVVGPQLPDGAVPVHDNDGYSALQHSCPGAGRGVVLADLLPGVGSAMYSGNYAIAMQPRRGGHGDVLVDLLPDGAGHGEAFVGLLPGDVDAAYDNYGYDALHTRPAARRGGDVFIGLLPDGAGMVFINSGNFAQRTTGADGIAGALRGPNLGAGYDNSRMVTGHLRRLLPFAGIGASSFAVNGLAACPGSPAVAFHLFVLLLGGLFLVILHVIHVQA